MDQPEKPDPAINMLFRMASLHKASDLYLEVGSAPRLSLQGASRLMQMPPLKNEDLHRLISPLLHDDQRQSLVGGDEVSFDYAVEESDLYRVVVSPKEGTLRLTARRLRAGT
jgi:Tfp pilus assembly pilus retraction ATPase PilT